MKKRITSFLLSVVIMFGIMAVGVHPVMAEDALTVSDECIRVLKEEEGFSAKPYWDYSQYTVGFGTRCPSDMVDYYMENGITEEEAEVLLRNHLIAVERDINQRIVTKYGLNLTQNQFDALVLFSYNCGTAWAFDTSGTFHNAIKNGATGNDLIRAFALWCSVGNQIKAFLLRRRLSEANMYLNGVYDKTPPENYCYVLYNANGGTTSPRSQGYDAELTAEPFPVPTYKGYIFQGWFTQKTGGEKVTVLDASTKSKTLYAQWKNDKGEAPPEHNIIVIEPIKVTVTSSHVNLRKGPGTNYTTTGMVNKGDKLTISEIVNGEDYTWGKCADGWLALNYTDYDTVIENQPDGTEPPETTKPEDTEPPETTKPEDTEPPETTKPEDTEPPETTKPEDTEPPETTKPEDTEPPETTKPEDTEPPETTKPEDTEPPETTKPEETEPPETTEPEKPKVTGTVNVQDWLNVRSGPGTGYSLVGQLKPKQKVEILEQKTIGSQRWGKISNGWVSMDYIVLDKGTSNDTSGDDSTGTTWTGTVVNANELRIRSGPGTDYAVLGYLKGGTKVTITQRKTNGSMEWGKIDKGWISLDYVKLSGTDNGNSSDKPADSETEKLTGIVDVQQWLRVRTGPGTSYAVAGYLKPKEKVTITQQKTVGGETWGKISQGWISMDYVILDSQSGSGNSGSSSGTQKVVKTIIADCLRIRSDAGTNHKIVGYLYYGAKVEILETKKVGSTTWGRISNGWISMDYAK